MSDVLPSAWGIIFFSICVACEADKVDPQKSSYYKREDRMTFPAVTVG